MNYKEKMDELLEKNMTEKGFKLWEGISKILPDAWNRPTSSTLKYHRKADGRVPDIAEHTYEMLFALVKLFRMFNYQPKTTNADALLLAIAFHDSLKYGNFGSRKHTDGQHDKNAADMIKSNESTFRKLLSEEQFNILEEGIRFHSGRWSTDVGNQSSFDWNDYDCRVFLVHVMDMLSTADCLKTDMRGNI
jgi:hypothetical protein